MGPAASIAAGHLRDGTGDPAFMKAKIATARYYAECLLPQAAGLALTVTEGGETALALAADQF